jgi:putative membrane protein
MNIVTQIFALAAVLFHVAAFVLESLLFGRPAVQTAALGRPDTSPALRLFAFNQGFYNLFLAAGPVAGLIAAGSGHVSVGRALVVYSCAFMTAAGLVLYVSNRKLWRGAIGQSGPPLIALIAALV